MATREELHNLIDSLPEGAIEAAHRTLSSLMAGPPPSDMATMRKNLEEKRLELRKRIEERLPRQPGTVSGFVGGGNFNPMTGSGCNSFSYWDSAGFVIQTYRQHLGHDMMVIERIRVEGQRLIYKHEITGPGEKHDEREIIFAIP